ncbi:DUF536 domain-containing protein [Enterococcus faecium]|nr:DUF536 domain-containing protein [Enterococcus faecium]
MQKLLDQQQQLTLQANQQIENLQEQLHLTYTEETPTTESTAFSEKKADNTQPLIEKSGGKFGNLIEPISKIF